MISHATTQCWREREEREGGKKGKREEGSMKCTLRHPNKGNVWTDVRFHRETQK